jgi:hypothetical protein
MRSKKASELTQCAADHRKLADAATDFTTRMHHRRIEEECAEELRARRAPGYTEPKLPENPKILSPLRPQ